MENNNYESEQKSSNLNQDLDLDQYLQELEINKLNFAREGRYDEAEELKARIEETKKAIKLKRLRDLQMQHSSEMDNLENNYRKELEECNDKWNTKFRELDDKSSKLEKELVQKHEREMEELYVYLEEKLPKNIKHSREYLEFKSQEEKLVKQQKYIAYKNSYKEASVIKKKIDNLEKVELDKWNQDKTEKIKSKSIKTANKHLLEKNALKQKLEAEYELIRRQQQVELDRIVHKYKNRKNDLEIQQKNERILLENPNILKSKTTTNKLKDKKTILFSNTFSSSPNKTNNFNSENAHNNQNHSEIDLDSNQIDNEVDTNGNAESHVDSEVLSS